MPVQRLKVAILPLDLPCSGPVPHSGEILTTGKAHGKKQDRFYLNKINTQITKRLKVTPILDKSLEYKRKWIQHVNRMSRNRISKLMKHYSPTGRRNYGRPLMRLLDTRDRNRSTSGPTP
jgi:hypothetical protein